MAKLRIVDDARIEYLYADLNTAMGERTTVSIGNNTALVRTMDGAIAVQLHSTKVVVVWPDNTLVFYTGGYDTVTTVERINHIAKRVGLTAYRKHGTAYLRQWKEDGYGFRWRVTGLLDGAMVTPPRDLFDVQASSVGE